MANRPGRLGRRVHDGTVSVVLRWTPQKRVDVALIVSARGHPGLCRPGLRAGAHGGGAGSRRRVATAERTRAVADTAPPCRASAGARLAVAAPGRTGPRRRPGGRPLTGVVAGAWPGWRPSRRGSAPSAWPPLVALLVPRLRFLLALAAVAGVAPQPDLRRRPPGPAMCPPTGRGPSFDAASQLAWAGVVFLGADGAVDIALRAPAPTGLPPVPGPTRHGTRSQPTDHGRNGHRRPATGGPAVPVIRPAEAG